MRPGDQNEPQPVVILTDHDGDGRMQPRVLYRGHQALNVSVIQHTKAGARFDAFECDPFRRHGQAPAMGNGSAADPVWVHDSDRNRRPTKAALNALMKIADGSLRRRMGLPILCC